MKHLAYFCFAVLLFSCSESTIELTSKSYTSYISGLGTPIRLNFDTTLVDLSDYITDVKSIEAVNLQGQTVHPDSSGILVITSNITDPVGNLEIISKGVKHDVPVFASEKVRYKLSFKATKEGVKEVGIAGSMNGWNYKSSMLAKEGDVWSISLVLNPGLYEYRIWQDGKEMLDPLNPNLKDNGMGAQNNTFFAGSEKEEMPELFTSDFKEGTIHLRLSSNQQPHVVSYFQNERIDNKVENNIVTIQIPKYAQSLDRSFIRVFSDDGRQRSNDVLIPLEKGKVVADAALLNRKDLPATIMYFMMVDRFNNGNPSNDRPTNDPAILPKANNLGGDLTGIIQKIKDGYFEKLGINTIWISPISRNPEGAWGLWNKGVSSKFSGYHGYWPISLRSVDDRFGTEAELKELIALAHDHNMNVILDYVAHHVHQEHPLIKEKPDWTTPLYLPDGTMNTEKWDEYRLTTWFDTFLPTWDFSKPEVVDALTDTAMYWVKNYDLDGFRHDATKHINSDFWRALTSKLKNEIAKTPGRQMFQIGETYGNPELISSYISSGQMDAQFDFNLYDAEVDAFAKGTTGFENLARIMDESMHYYGSHHLMGNITGNQDRARFTSFADGSVKFDEDPKRAGWVRNIENNGKVGFDRMAMLNVFLMTTPGIPCIYYGDEIGMPGANDPDNRRMMTFTGWNEDQQQLYDQVAKLVHLRRENIALTYGDTKMLVNNNSTLAYARNYFGKIAIVIFQKGFEESEVSLVLPETINLKDLQVLNGSSYSIEGNTLKVKMKMNSSEVLYN